MTVKSHRRGCALWCALSLLVPVSLSWGQGTIIQSEPDDSIPTAHDSGLTAGTSGVKIAYGHTGDGPYGQLPYGDGMGNGTGDVDFYKLTANAGQTIFINVNNAGIDPDFDSYVGIYNAAGVLQKKLDANGNPVLNENNEPVDIDGVDDAGNTSRGYDRTSKVVYKVPTTGTYYVYVGNWIEAGSSPTDPNVPGSSLGLPGGKAGPYQLVLGLDVAVPVPQFIAGSTGYPVPAFLPEKVFGTPRYDGTLTITNTSPGAEPGANLVISSYNVTGPDAARFIIKGLVTPAVIRPGEELNVRVSFNAGGSPSQAEADLNFVSNDPFNQPFVLDTLSSPVIGGGTFTVKQVNSTAAVGSLETADELLAGTIPGTVYNGTTSRINYGGGNERHWGGDLPFLNGGTDPNNIALQVTGTFRVRAAGTYSFMSTADDGHRLRVDGEDVITQANYQDADFFGNIVLTAGDHVLEYTMYEGASGNHAELSISQRLGIFETYISTNWELLEAAGADADNDDLPDSYETANGLSPNSAAGNDGPSGDPDTDGSTNIQEYVNGTNPQVGDTDADGLLDGVESDSSNYVGTGDTGTSPLIADTDKDGLPDGVENPALPTTGFTQSGTSPVKLDSDGDGVADGVEVALGSDPKLSSSVPAAFTYVTALGENFDGGGVNSRYVMNRLNAGTDPMLVESGGSHGLVAQITGAEASNHNSLTFDYVDLPSVPAVKISVDFKMMNNDQPADGFGIGLFRKSAYGVTGISPAITGTPAWENATYPNALMFGFSVYGTDVVRVTGPANPNANLASFNPPLTLTNGLFNRAVITVTANGASSSMVKLEIIYDIDGTPTTQLVFDNVLVPGFTVTNEDFRVIAGGRTGQFFVETQLDNLAVAIASQSAPSLVLANTPTGFTADIHDGLTSTVTGGTVTATVNGTPVTVTSPKTGSITKVTFAGSPGAFFPVGENTVVFNYTTSAGPVTETRAITIPPYNLLDPALAQPAGNYFVPGFGIRTYQVAATSAVTFPGSIDYAEAILAGATGGGFFTPGNLADLSLAESGVFRADTINFEQAAGIAGYFSGDLNIPGIPGTTGSDDNYIFEALTWMEFPAPGIYKLGVNADDGFRLSAGHAPVARMLNIVTPAASAAPVAAVASVINEGGAFPALPNPPITRKVVYAVPGDAATALTNATEMAGNIALIDRGAVAFAIKIKNAQNAGAVGVIIAQNEANAAALPFSMGGDASVTGITISGVMVSKPDGDYLKTLIAGAGGLEVQYGADKTGVLALANPNAVTNFQVAVSVAGLYPLRFLNFEGGGGANAEIYSVDSLGVRHLVNDMFDESAMKAWSALSPDPAAILLTKTATDMVIYFKGVLQSSTGLAAPNGFTDVPDAFSPYIVPAGGPPRLFFRARPAP